MFHGRFCVSLSLVVTVNCTTGLFKEVVSLDFISIRKLNFLIWKNRSRLAEPCQLIQLYRVILNCVKQVKGLCSALLVKPKCFNKRGHNGSVSEIRQMEGIGKLSETSNVFKERIFIRFNRNSAPCVYTNRWA